MRTWIKLYTEVLDDPKMAKLSLAEFGVWTLLLALAGKLDARDANDDPTGELDTTENIAWHLRRPVEEIAPMLSRFAELKMLHQEGEVWVISNFAKFQRVPPSKKADRVKERVARHRARKRYVTGMEAAMCNNVSEECNGVTGSCNVPRIEKNRKDTEENDVDDSQICDLERYLQGLGYSTQVATELARTCAQNGWEERDIMAWWYHIAEHNRRHRKGKIAYPLGFLRAKIENNDRMSQQRMAELLGLEDAARQTEVRVEESAPVVLSEDEQIWLRVVNRLQMELTPSAFWWIRSAHAERRDGKWVIHCANPLARDWLANRGAGVLRRAFTDIGESGGLEFV